MDEKTHKERLEQELRFLKESLEAEVISKEEFERGRERIEKKLQDNHESNNEKNITEAKSTEIIEPKEEKIKLKVIQEESEPHYAPQQTAEIHKTEDKAEAKGPDKNNAGKKENNNLFKYSVVFVVLLLVVFFSYSLLKSSSGKQEAKDAVKLTSACSSDSDCMMEGKEGTCLQPGTKDAKCEFKAIEKISILVINDRKNCFNCDSGRVLGVLDAWFGAVEGKELDYNSNEGKELAQKIGARMLPAYVLDENITKNPGFKKYRQAFAKKEKYYVLSDDAAGSTFYFGRDMIPNKLDLLVIAGESAGIRAENNLKEFLNAFKDVKFEKHLSDSKLAKELGIKAFPAFLVNNQVKFTGVQTADAIRNNFCSLNKVIDCDKELSKSLV